MERWRRSCDRRHSVDLSDTAACLRSACRAGASSRTRKRSSRGSGPFFCLYFGGWSEVGLL